MFSIFLRHFRIAIIVCIGIALALATAGGIFLSLKVDPESLSLRERIDPDSTMVFIATPEKQKLFDVMDHLVKPLRDDLPQAQDIAPADLYEFALLDSGSGSTDWIVYGRNLTEATHVVMASRDPITLLLPIAKRRQSLAMHPLLATASAQASSLVWLKTALLPLPQSDVADVARAILSPYKELVVLFDATGRGKVLLTNSTMNLQGSVVETKTASGTPLLMISMSEPAKILQNIASALRAQNLGLAEGLEGILKAQSEKFVGTSDVSHIVHDLLVNPASLILERSTDGHISVVVAGSVASSIIRDSWLKTMATTMKTGNVRRLELFQKEYTRTDVTADDGHAWRESGTYQNWSLRQLGGTGSDLTLFVATSGRRYIAGNDELGVKRIIDAGRGQTSLGSGTADIGWLSSEIETLLPFLRPTRGTTEALLGASSGRLLWRMTTAGGTLTIEWSLEP